MTLFGNESHHRPHATEMPNKMYSLIAIRAGLVLMLLFPPPLFVGFPEGNQIFYAP
jgi:hypothetical protein